MQPARPHNKPISQKRLDANRRNALKSTGPSSPGGRAVASQNARRFHLLPSEDPALPAQLTAQYYGHFIPANREERALVDVLVLADRLRRHFLSLEAQGLERQSRSPQPAFLKDASSGPRRSMTISWGLEFTACAARNARRQLDALRA